MEASVQQQHILVNIPSRTVTVVREYVLYTFYVYVSHTDGGFQIPDSNEKISFMQMNTSVEDSSNTACIIGLLKYILTWTVVAIRTEVVVRMPEVSLPKMNRFIRGPRDFVHHPTRASIALHTGSVTVVAIQWPHVIPSLVNVLIHIEPRIMDSQGSIKHAMIQGQVIGDGVRLYRGPSFVCLAGKQDGS